jgi:hypothetical protein
MTEMTWAGAERRGIPVEVLNYVKTIVAEETSEIKQAFDDHRRVFEAHDRGEMVRYDTIIRNQREFADAAEERYSQLIKSVDSYTQKGEDFHEHIREAFLVNRHGKPDFIGHANAHEAWMTEASENKRMREFIRKTVIGAAVTGVGSWVIMLMWSGILQGPAK